MLEHTGNLKKRHIQEEASEKIELKNVNVVIPRTHVHRQMELSSAIRNVCPEDKSPPKLWTAKECPFAERAVIGLHELGVQFEAVEVDLKNKPTSLFEVNSKGLVPAMKDQGNCINDSYIILQYIEEMWSSNEKSLLPRIPADRAIARTWCDFINKNVASVFYEVLLKESDEEREAAKVKLLSSIKILDEALQQYPSGPFFFGGNFGMVDIMLAPHVERFGALKHFRGFEVPENDEYKHFHLWWKNVQEHPSFQPARVDNEFIIQVYKSYAENKANSKVAEAVRKGQVIP
ncbi:uncharacterized protein LOC135696812 isoform X1 [Rhopilema esculentum]|uniref:uncharacterized protein LOC135696812 isoform X1 n=2 Tax=Rhopilema esculentum TaxID=499914 RepID=UPI0031D96E25